MLNVEVLRLRLVFGFCIVLLCCIGDGNGGKCCERYLRRRKMQEKILNKVT